MSNLSSWPTAKDNLYALYDEKLAGYPIVAEAKTIPTSPYVVTLNHYARKNTISISGYTEVFGATAITSKTFKVSDYAVPTNTHTGITYEIGRSLTFYSGDSGNTLAISYTTPGDKILASEINLIRDAITNIEDYIGLSSQLNLGSYSTLLRYLAWIKGLLLSHTHTGGANNSETTKKLTTDAFSSLALGNEHFTTDVDKKLVQSKIVNGITSLSTGTILTASSYVDINDTNITALSKVFCFRTGGVDVGTLQETTASRVVGTSFRIAFITASARTQNVTFNYIIFN